MDGVYRLIQSSAEPSDDDKLHVTVVGLLELGERFDTLAQISAVLVRIVLDSNSLLQAPEHDARFIRKQ